MPALNRWRRNHANLVVAETTPIRGMGTWSACACRLADPETIVRVSGKFRLLTEAQAAADELVRTEFEHVCSHACGEWTRRIGRAGVNDRTAEDRRRTSYYRWD
jgi:hypothetical protein